MAPKLQIAVRPLPGLANDPIEAPGAFYQRAVLQHWDPALPKTVHVLGCGHHGFLSALNESWTVFGSDTSPEKVNSARLFCPRADLRQGSGFVFDLFGRSFGLVAALDGFPSQTNLEQVGKSVKEQLVPGGLFLFHTGVELEMPHGEWLTWASRHFDLLLVQPVPARSGFAWMTQLRSLVVPSPLLVVARKRHSLR